MPVEIKLPQLGESIHEGTIARWLKQPGDRIEKYEPLVEITTDKVNIEMPSPYAGVLRELLAAEGDTRPVGSAIALLDAGTAEGPAGSSEVPVPTRSAPAPDGTPSRTEPTTGGGAEAVAPVAKAAGGLRLSPLVRKLAEEHGIPLADLDALPGTGAGGRVTKDDVLAHAAARTADAAPAALRPAASAATVRGPGDEVLKVSPIRRAIAQRMAQSKREIPHAYGVIEVDMQAVVGWREAAKAAWQAREAVPLTYTAFFIRAASAALRAVAMVNASWTDDGIVVRQAVNVGVGMAVDDGLVVPVIHNADQLSLAGIARALDDLSRRARAGRLGLGDVQGGTFTITNPGVFGSIWSMPIVVPGQAAILATDAIVKRAVVRDDAIAIRPIMHLGMAFDHRIFDGATSMEFLNHMKGWLETFSDGR
jgi:pyruvate/2-oxoglutarate dehydrogenase complex dihydrolipoamide acyltransferase (E2) component